MSFFDDPPLRDFPDHAMRRMLEDPANLRDLVGAALPQLVDRMDFSRVEYEPREFLMEDWRKRECDLFVRVPFRTGAGAGHVLVCVLVEHQSSPDPRLPLRTLVYAVGYWEREWKAWEQRHDYGQPLLLTPILPIVFYSGSAAWNAGLHLADLFPDLAELRAFVPQWAPLLWDLSTQAPAALLASAGASLQALTVVRMEEEELARFEDGFRQVCQRLDQLHRSERMRALDLLGFVLSWVRKRRPGAEYPRLVEVIRDSLTDEVIQREVDQMGSKLGDTIEDIARRDGELRYARRFLLVVLQERLGALPEPIVQQINACQDLSRLEAWSRQAARVESLEGLRLE